MQMASVEVYALNLESGESSVSSMSWSVQGSGGSSPEAGIEADYETAPSK